MIREACRADVPHLVAIGRLMHGESPQWSRLDYAPTKVELMLSGLIGDPRGFVLVAEIDDRIVGGIVAQAAAHWASRDLVASEVAFFLLPEHRGTRIAMRLVQQMHEWAYQLGCVMLQAGCSTGVADERTAHFYERLGFTRCTIGLERFYGRD